VMAALAGIVHDCQSAGGPDHNHHNDNQRGSFHCDVATAMLHKIRTSNAGGAAAFEGWFGELRQATNGATEVAAPSSKKKHAP